MIDAINTAGAALRANQQWLDSISRNVANLNTPAYKAEATGFAAALNARGEATALVQAQPQEADLRTGDIRQTGRELDVAINGAGYLRVIDSDGQLAYTRLGRLVVNGDGQLAAANGWPLADDIRVPPDTLALVIGTDGRVFAKLPGQAQPVPLGALQTVHLPSPSALTETSPGFFRDGSRLLAFSAGTPGDGLLGSLQQGHLEFSNVDLVNEMTQLVLAQRAYQLNARVLQIGDEALATVNNLRR
jgi:flagellar basal-body rod protein FlgG